MSQHQTQQSALRPAPDALFGELADYVLDAAPFPAAATETAKWCLLDSLGCAMEGLGYDACRRHVGPVVPGAVLPGGCRVPGTAWELEPVRAAFCIGAMVRWLDFNDTWLAAEWGHPSDNLGAILAVASWLDRRAAAGEGGPRILGRDVLRAAIQAHEIQGVLALDHAFNRVGLDHVLLVRIASTAVATRLLGGDRAQVINALSNAWLDGGALRTYRHAPNTGPRKSWAAGDATSRAVWHALQAVAGETGYPSALTAVNWGFQDVLFKGRPIALSRPLGSYVMENVLFKISFPAEFHAQTAVEAALRLHPQVAGRLDDIAEIRLATQEPGVRIISKSGPLANPADRDHCLQYMVAVPLLHGRLTAADYEDAIAADPRIDRLRGLMTVAEEPEFTAGYYDPDRRAIGNRVQVLFKDGTATEAVTVEYPVGHRRRRAEGWPLLAAKYRAQVSGGLPLSLVPAALALADGDAWLDRPIDNTLRLFVP